MAEKNDKKTTTEETTTPAAAQPEKKKLPQLGALEDDDEFEVSCTVVVKLWRGRLLTIYRTSRPLVSMTTNFGLGVWNLHDTRRRRRTAHTACLHQRRLDRNVVH